MAKPQGIFEIYSSLIFTRGKLSRELSFAELSFAEIAKAYFAIQLENRAKRNQFRRKIAQSTVPKNMATGTCTHNS